MPQPNYTLAYDGEIKETDKAFGLIDNKGQLRWFPKSQVTEQGRKCGRITLTVPGWLVNGDNQDFEYEEE